VDQVFTGCRNTLDKAGPGFFEQGMLPIMKDWWVDFRYGFLTLRSSSESHCSSSIVDKSQEHDNDSLVDLYLTGLFAICQ
jgi:hypothetical protein